MNISIQFTISTIYLIIGASVLIGILLGRLSMSTRKMLQSIHGKNTITINHKSPWLGVTKRVRHG